MMFHVDVKLEERYQAARLTQYLIHRQARQCAAIVLIKECPSPNIPGVVKVKSVLFSNCSIAAHVAVAALVTIAAQPRERRWQPESSPLTWLRLRRREDISMSMSISMSSPFNSFTAEI